MAPIFVGSENENSRIRSDRLGFAASTSDPGTAAEGDGYYNSSDNQLKFYDGSAWSAIQGSGTVGLVASGTLSNGQTVVVTSDGKVAGIGSTVTSQSNGSPTAFSSANGRMSSATFDSSNGKVVIAYADLGNSSYGTAVVGTVSGNTISFGTPVVFKSADIYHSTHTISAVYDSTNEKVVIFYSDGGNSNYGKAVVGTVSGTSISFGSEATFESAQVEFVSAAYDSTNGKIVIAYKDDGNSDRGTAIVGTVSGTSISFGSATVFNSATTRGISVVHDSTNGKTVISYRDDGNNGYGTAIVGTVSGTSISFGSEVVFKSAYLGAAYGPMATFDSTNGKVIIGYTLSSDNSGNVIVGTVSGTSISFGTAVTYDSSISDYSGMVFDSFNNKVLVAYRNDTSPTKLAAIVGTVSGTSISFGSLVELSAGQSDWISPTFDSINGKVVIAFTYNPDSNQGKAVVFQNAGTNLTAQNFIGFSNAAYTDGQTANIQIISSIDDAQSGLTTGSIHYVQTDGTLSTTAGTPSVEAGTALSDTKIRIKS